MLATREGFTLALQWRNLLVDDQSDCLAVVSMFVSSGINRSRNAFLVRQIQESMKERSSCITHIRRSQNSSSHHTASFGRLQGRTAVWLGSGLEDVLSITQSDCNA